MKIKVTRRHILEGVPRDVTQCPIAFAIMDIVNAPFVRSGMCIYVGESQDKDEGTRYCYRRATQTEQRFMIDFDKGEEVHPFEFELDIPPQFMKQVTEQEDQDEADPSARTGLSFPAQRSESSVALPSAGTLGTSCSLTPDRMGAPTQLEEWYA